MFVLHSFVCKCRSQLLPLFLCQFIWIVVLLVMQYLRVLFVHLFVADVGANE